jgi:hypothetical protein
MNSAKIFATIVTAIALFPAASFANNVSGSEQEVNLNSTLVGNGNTAVTDIQQKSIRLQNSGFFGNNVGASSQKVNANTTIFGNGNIDIKKAVQSILNGQKAK